MITETDKQHFRRCVELAEEALVAGDEPFGAVLVSGDRPYWLENTSWSPIRAPIVLIQGSTGPWKK